MTALQSILMGAVQGITEFLPISSSAHLIVIPWFFKISEANINSMTYDVMLHFGSLLAVLLLYGKKFTRPIIEGLVDFRDGRGSRSILLKLVIATIPAVVAGFLGKGLIEHYLRAPIVAAFMLALVAIMMIVAERIAVDRSSVTMPIGDGDEREEGSSGGCLARDPGGRRRSHCARRRGGVAALPGSDG